MRDQVVERVGDAHEQRVERLLGEHLVEHVGEPPIGIEELGARGERDVLRHEPEARGRPHNHPPEESLRVAGVASPDRGNRHGMTDTAAVYVPERPTLPKLRAAAAGCRACPLWEHATQTVFGEGRAGATVMLVGEQPGNEEDLEGRPFVGPAGRLLDDALDRAGIERSAAYVTNAVKHFKWEARGTRRIHAKPAWTEQQACRPWLEAELAVVEPAVLVLLGATAAQSLLGRQFRVTKERGRWLDSDLAPHVLATIHPSAVLRQRDRERRRQELADLVADLASYRACSRRPHSRVAPARSRARKRSGASEQWAPRSGAIETRRPAGAGRPRRRLALEPSVLQAPRRRARPARARPHNRVAPARSRARKAKRCE